MGHVSSVVLALISVSTLVFSGALLVPVRWPPSLQREQSQNKRQSLGKRNWCRRMLMQYAVCVECDHQADSQAAYSVSADSCVAGNLHCNEHEPPV